MERRAHGGRKQRRISALNTAILLTLFYAALFLLLTSLPVYEEKQQHDNHLLSQPQQQVVSPKDDNYLSSLRKDIGGSRITKICPNLPFHPQAVREAIEKNEAHHKWGGNMKAVQNFRDSVIDETLQRLHLKFIPDNIDDNKPRRESFFEMLQRHYQTIQKNNDTRGGYGQPLPGKFVRQTLFDNNNNETSLTELFENRWIEPIETFRGRRKWKHSLGPIGPKCPNLITLGRREKFFCSSSKTIMKHEKNDTSSSSCQIISVGGNDNWKLELQLLNVLDRNCMIHTFDCTLPNNTPIYKPNNTRIQFYPHCLDSTTHVDAHGRSFLTYSDMIQMIVGESTTKAPLLYFKLDVEGFEYDIFRQMISSSSSSLPRQIQVELHWATRMTDVEWMPRTLGAGELALFSSMMYLGGGYMPIHISHQRYCLACVEVLYYKVLC